MRQKNEIEFKLSDEALALVARRFKVLSDPRRLKILQEIKGGGLCGKEIINSTGMPQSTVSKQLTALVDEGIVSRQQEGTQACFSIADPLILKMCESICASLKERAIQEASLFST